MWGSEGVHCVYGVRTLREQEVQCVWCLDVGVATRITVCVPPPPVVSFAPLLLVFSSLSPSPLEVSSA